MTKRLAVAVAFAAVTAVPLHAQSDESIIAWFSMMATPIGALPPIELASAGAVDRRSQFAIRLASWEFQGSEERTNNVGVSWIAAVGPTARFGATLGWIQPEETGADGTILLGADLGAPIWTSMSTEATAVSIDLRGSLGYGRYTGTGADNAYSLVAQLPIKVRHELTGKSAISGFLSPGFGFAGLSNEFTRESGTRPLIAVGGAWTSASGIGVHLSGQQVMLNADPNPPWVWGITMTFPMGPTP